MTRSKIIAGFVAASALLVNAAFAAGIDGSIGNTVVMTAADGAKMEFRHAADGTVKVKLPDGSEDNATWKVDGNTLIETSGKDGKEYKFDISGGDRKVGDKWEGKDADGNPVSFELVAGQ